MRRLWHFLTEGQWRVELREQAWPARIALSALRVGSHVAETYSTHLVGIRAAGLALVTLLSVVPLLAVAFAVAGAFGFRETLETTLLAETEGLPEHLATILQQIDELVKRTSFEALGGIGTVLLAWTGLMMFARVEESLNFTWRSGRRRAWLRRITSFLALIVIVPALLLGALAISGALTSGPLVERLRHDVPALMSVYDSVLWLVPHAMAWVAMIGVYRLMPSADVHWLPAILSGISAGSSLVWMHQLYVGFQVGVARTNAIYATLAAIPLLVIYLQVVWTILLVGAEIGYAIQNLHLLGPGRDPGGVPFAMRERMALRLVDRSVAAHRGGGPLSLTAEAQAADVPREWLDAIVTDLERAGLLARTQAGAIVPARDPAGFGTGDVIDAVRGTIDHGVRARLSLSPPVEAAVDALARARAAIGAEVFVLEPGRTTAERMQ